MFCKYIIWVQAPFPPFKVVIYDLIYMGSVLYIRDNSGARWVRCIKVVGKGKKVASVGDFILVTVVNYILRKNLKKRRVYLGVIICIVAWLCRPDGSNIKFFSNGALLFTRKYKFLGTRIFGVFSKEVQSLEKKTKKNKKYLLKLISYSHGLL